MEKQMKRVVGFSGAQGVGKTTLLNALRDGAAISKLFTFRDEVTRWVGGLGLPINESGTEATQQLIAMRHIYNLQMYDSFITDRTMLDCYVYTKWLYRKGKVSAECLEEITRITHRILPLYDAIIYIRPEFELVDDGVRSVSTTYRDEIVNLFEDVIFEMFSNGHQLSVISGTVEQRVKQVKDIIREIM
jgi:predicted ATPase